MLGKLNIAIQDIFECVRGWCYAITHLREKEPEITCWEPVNVNHPRYPTSCSSSSVSPSGSYYSNKYPYSYHCNECDVTTYCKEPINQCSVCSKIQEDFLTEEEMLL